eukprot:1740698-Rhodomonas_salina.1
MIRTALVPARAARPARVIVRVLAPPPGRTIHQLQYHQGYDATRSSAVPGRVGCYALGQYCRSTAEGKLLRVGRGGTEKGDDVDVEDHEDVRDEGERSEEVERPEEGEEVAGLAPGEGGELGREEDKADEHHAVDADVRLDWRRPERLPQVRREEREERHHHHQAHKVLVLEPPCAVSEPDIAYAVATRGLRLLGSVPLHISAFVLWAFSDAWLLLA